LLDGDLVGCVKGLSLEFALEGDLRVTGGIGGTLLEGGADFLNNDLN
jgi:hypothetical protein